MNQRTALFNTNHCFFFSENCYVCKVVKSAVIWILCAFLRLRLEQAKSLGVE